MKSLHLTAVAVALAALSGAVAAQSAVTISGKYAFAYESVTEFGTGLKTRGFQTTDGNVTFAASEDLGGGMKADVSMDLRLRGRGNANEGVKVGGRDATIGLSGGFGSIVAGSVESYNALIDLAAAGAPTIGLDGTNTLDGGVGNVDMVRYTTPEMGGFSFYATVMDSVGAPGAGGMQSGAATAGGFQIGANISMGDLTANVDFVDVDQNASGSTDDKRFAVSAMYDLGAFAVGAGYQTFKQTGGAPTNKQMLLGVSAPLSDAITVGATYGNQKVAGVATVKGYELGMHYALSKRTGVRVAYQRESQTGTISGNTFQVRAMHTF